MKFQNSRQRSSGREEPWDARPRVAFVECVGGEGARRGLVVKGPEPRLRDAAARLVGSCSEANYLKRNSAMDDSIGGS